MEKKTEKVKLTKEEKIKKKQRAASIRKLIGEFSRGTVHHFVTGMIAILTANLSAYCIPLITSFTIDYVLLDYAEAGYQG
ncbi:MAG: hypothetical protein II191_02945, partial [Clostridia bacterium]|nr:hypothetical protein [Clostridia bacterium]